MDVPTFDELVRSETERVEWKQSLRDSDGIREAVCAFANDLSASGRVAHVLVGVQKDGTIVGVDTKAQTIDEAQQSLVNRLHDILLQPTPSVAVTTVEPMPGVHVVVVEVTPYAVPPVVTLKGVAWVRVGTTTRRATEADQARLRERRPEKHQPFDVRLVVGATLDDLDVGSLKQRYEAARIGDEDAGSFPSFGQWLVQQELGRQTAGDFAPNTTAVLLFGKSPQSFFPGAVVEVARYAGSDVDANVSFRHSVTGSLPDQLDALWKHMKSGVVAVPKEKDGIREQFAEEYPLEALEELVRNLVQHRAYDVTHAPARIEWFDNRIELSNPGGPFGHASEGEFGSFSDYRNPTITRTLSELGYVQKLGRGVRRVRLALNKNGSPPLETETDGYTHVIVRRRAL
ncbi:MAG: putative DNA binding domain-containing protein [Deltaproteobacteria bacterium]|nr:putative DNA binding domain-containing protein [Deltaproteobacteria bacterium]